MADQKIFCQISIVKIRKNNNKYFKKWYKKNKKKHIERTLICNKARYAHPDRKKCSIKGCNNLGERHHPDYSKPKEIIWLCKKHHEIIHQKHIFCSTIGCDKKHYSKGLCIVCYKKNQRKENIVKNKLKKRNDEYLKKTKKRCYKCGKEKVLYEFYKDLSRKDGFSFLCKICKSKLFVL